MIKTKQEAIELLNQAIDNVEAIDGSLNAYAQNAIEQIERVRDEWLTVKDGVNIDVDIKDDVFMKIAELAHADDITFNQKVKQILIEQIEREESDESETA